MGFNVKGRKKDNTDRVNFNLKDSAWSITNVRVVTEHMVSFTLNMHGLALYNMKVIESTKGDNVGRMFLSNGQSKGSDGKYYNNYALYLSDEDSEAIIEAVCTEATKDEE
nr:MAG TPA: hypothetical protein [Caudoviricetes sp.]